MKTHIILFTVAIFTSCSEPQSAKIDDYKPPKIIYHGQILKYSTEFLLQKTYILKEQKIVESGFIPDQSLLFLSSDRGFMEVKSYDNHQNFCVKDRILTENEIQELRSELFAIPVCEYIVSDIYSSPLIANDSLNLNYCFNGSCNNLILSDLKFIFYRTGMSNCSEENYASLNDKLTKWAEDLAQICP